MVKINQSLEINNQIEFDDETDVLKRKSFGESLFNLIRKSENDSLVISVNAKWGEGKTDFLKRWQNYLNKQEINTIYFNSFKNDFIEDPFIPLLGEILNIFGEKTSTEGVFKKGINIIKGILPLAGKVGARWLMKGDNEQINNDLEKLIEGDIVKEISNKLERYLEKDRETEDFKEVLEKIIKEKGELVFIIDELDRCRPDFALRLLERIKHFFDIKGLYFVLGINKEQIERYIEKIYGNIDSKTYLQKFIDIETVLPKKVDDIYGYGKNGDIGLFIKNQIEKNKNIFIEKNENDLDNRISALTDLSEKYNLELRGIEKVINYLIIFRKSLGENRLELRGLTMALIYLRAFDIDKYSEFKKGKLDKKDIVEILKLEVPSKDNHYIKWIKEDLDFVLNEELTLEMREKYKSLSRYYYHYDSSIETRKEILKNHFEILDSFNI